MSGHAALKHEPEVLFCDDETPGLNGLQTLQHLQHCDLEIPVIVFAASSGEGTAMTLMRAGATDVLSKHHLEAVDSHVSRALSTSARQAKRRQSAKDLRQQLEHNRRMLDSTLDAFIAIDRVGTISEWNIRAAEMFGWSRDEALLWPS